VEKDWNERNEAARRRRSLRRDGRR
jgi:hypothetical protein